jgi:hypothetical protein
MKKSVIRLKNRGRTVRRLALKFGLNRVRQYRPCVRPTLAFTGESMSFGNLTLLPV